MIENAWRLTPGIGGRPECTGAQPYLEVHRQLQGGMGMKRDV